MRRKTFESFGSKPLLDRTNIIITRDEAYQAKDSIVVHTIDEALQAAGEAEEVMVIAGASFYEQMLPRADRLYLAYLHSNVEGDAWFPNVDLSDWGEVERINYDAEEKNSLAHSFVILDKK